LLIFEADPIYHQHNIYSNKDKAEYYQNKVHDIEVVDKVSAYIAVLLDHRRHIGIEVFTSLLIYAEVSTIGHLESNELIHIGINA
jgi:hypothetical protein